MDTRRIERLAGVLALLVALPLGAASLDELALHQHELRQDLRAMEERLRRIEAQLASQGLLQLHNQLQELRAELTRLQGQQEEQQYALTRLDKRQKDIYEDLDGRLRELAARGQTAPVTAEPVQLQPSRTLLTGTVDAQAEARRYEAALDQFRNGDYAGAVRAFQAYLAEYPAGSMASNALYWLGLSHATLGDYASAVQTYQQLLNEFPNSNKVPDAMLSMARARLQMGERATAQSLLEQLVARYPQSRSAESARRLLATLK